MDQPHLPEWESSLIDDAIREAERRYREEREATTERARRRAVQLAREQAYHRLALEIDRPHRRGAQVTGQLSLFPSDPTLFDAG
ncbi:MAG TPA: hypothetical protein VM573_10255 [Actinomycetota bacterium]|jgi:hypothetical protein|nr:hypothetical protein [Actinomycetota bacterium]